MSRILRLLLLSLALLVLIGGVLWLAAGRGGTARGALISASPGVDSTTAPAVVTPASVGPNAGPTVAPPAATAAGTSDSAAGDEESDPILDGADPYLDFGPTPLPPGPEATARAGQPRQAHLTFELVFRNDGPGTVTSLDLYVAVPENRDNQTISGLRFSAPYTLTHDRYDQPIAWFRFTDLAPGRQARVTWDGDVAVWAMDYGLDPAAVGSLADIPADIVKLYTADEEKYRLSSPTIQAAARTAAKGATSPYWIARNVHDYVAAHLGYRNDGQWDDAETVYRQATGSCSEYSFLFVALARANGLPARYVAGTRQRAEGTYVDRLFHRWTEVYLPPYGWVPVDTLHDDRPGGPYTAYFGGISDERFATTVGGGDSEYLGWNYHYGYRSEYSGSQPRLERTRRFTWQP